MHIISFLPRQKIFLLTFLIFFLVYLIIPQFSFSAQQASPPTFNIPQNCATESGRKASQLPMPEFDLGTFDFLNKFVIAIVNVLGAIFHGIGGLLLYLFSVVQTNIFDKKITSGFGKDVWAEIRNLGNMLIALGFVIIGIATSLRLRDYEAKKLLFPLIAIAILINFSALFSGIIIDASNFVMHGLNQGGQSPYESARVMRNTIGCTLNTLGRAAASQNNVPLFAQYYGLGIFLWIVFDFAIALAIVIYLARYVILTMLFILSPLAFVFWVFPQSKKLWTSWWDHFLKWCFIGIGLSFSFFLASKVLTAGNIFSDATMRLFLALIFIIIGIKMTTKSTGLASMASGAIMGLAGGAAGMAWGASKAIGGAGAKSLDKLTGNKVSGALQNAKSRAGRFAEWAGWKGEGSALMNDQKRVDEEAKGLAANYAAAKATGNTAEMKRIQQLAVKGNGVKNAAAYKVISDAKDLHKAFADSSHPGGVDLAKAAERAQIAEKMGAMGVIKNSENAMPALAGYNPATFEDIKAKNKAKGLVWSDAQVRREAVRQKNAGMGISDMRNMPDGQINSDHLEDVSFKTYQRAALDYSTEQRNAAKNSLAGEGGLRDKRNIAMGFAGATVADRQASFDAYRRLSAANKAAYKASLTADERKKMDDLNKKIAFTKKL